MRIGWLVVPAALLAPVRHAKLLADQGTSRIEQHAFADFLTRGELDRHLRRMRASYRRRRDALVEALADELPEATIGGIAAGLHATVELPDGDDDRAILDEARRRRVILVVLSDYWTGDRAGAPTLFLGYAQIPEPAIRPGVRELAEAVRATRA